MTMATKIQKRADEILSDLIEPIDAELTVLYERRDAILAQMTEVTSGIRKLERVRRTITEEPGTPRRSSRAGKAGKAVSEERIQSALAWMRKQGPEFTTKELTAHFGWGTGVSSNIVALLRERGQLRLVGKRGQSKGYALIDN